MAAIARMTHCFYVVLREISYNMSMVVFIIENVTEYYFSYGVLFVIDIAVNVNVTLNLLYRIMDRFLVSSSKPSTTGQQNRNNDFEIERYDEKETDSDSSSQEVQAEKARFKKRKISYQQKFSDRWAERFGTWLSKAPNSDSSYCKVCSKTIQGAKSHLERHEKSTHHIKRMKAMKHTVLIEEGIKKIGKNEMLIKEGELKLAMFLVEHDLSFNLMKHLPKLLASVCSDSKTAQGLMSSRTKTTETIKNVIGPYAAKEINKDLSDGFYSIIIDETTDITTKKCLCVLIRYFSDKKFKVCDRFLALIEMVGSKADDIFNALINCLQTNNLSLQIKFSIKFIRVINKI